MKKKVILLFTIVFAALFMLSSTCSSAMAQSTSADVLSDDLKITVFNVGKGDCILLREGGHAMMIDTGYKETIHDVLEEIKQAGVSSLDCMILTHYDKDHAGGAPELLTRVPVASVYAPDYVQEKGKTYKNYQNTLKQTNIRPVLLHEPTEIQLGHLYVTMYPSHEHTGMTPNDHSVITVVRFRDQKFLFMGDATDQRMTDFLSEVAPEKYDMMKVPHHGLFMMQIPVFRKLVADTNPEYCIITDSAKYKLNKDLDIYLELCHAKTYRLRNGEINIVSDGFTTNVSQVQ